MSSFFFLIPPKNVPPANLGILEPNIELKKSCVLLPLCTLYPFLRGTTVSLFGVNDRLPLLSSIISCLNPPGPLPRPLSPTTAIVSLFIAPLVIKSCVCVECVPVGSLGISAFTPIKLPTLFIPSITLFRPDLTLLVRSSINPFVLSNTLSTISFILYNAEVTPSLTLSAISDTLILIYSQATNTQSRRVDVILLPEFQRPLNLLIAP